MIKRTIPLSSAEKILKMSGADRISDDAKIILRDTIEEIAEEIAEKASKLASHAGRKTVKSEDIKLAAKQ